MVNVTGVLYTAIAFFDLLDKGNQKKNIPQTSQVLVTSLYPMGRVGKDAEMAGTVLYYASEAGAYCSGSVHVIDGGRLSVQPGATY
jgi:NAD(P)-dependent dehydrogenase (short-subunit alcohol dehydrogenase family)